MSYQTWHTYGYGIRTSDITVDSPKHIQELLHMAPAFEKAVNLWLYESDVEHPKVSDYLEFDQCYYLGLANLLQEVILEAEGIEFTACDDYDGTLYLLYEPSYPWQTPEKEKNITEKQVEEILSKYVSFLTEQEITIDYYSAENGG